MKKEEPYTNVMKKYEKVYKQAKKLLKVTQRSLLELNSDYKIAEKLFKTCNLK